MIPAKPTRRVENNAQLISSLPRVPASSFNLSRHLPNIGTLSDPRVLRPVHNAAEAVTRAKGIASIMALERNMPPDNPPPDGGQEDLAQNVPKRKRTKAARSPTTARSPKKEAKENNSSHVLGKKSKKVEYEKLPNAPASSFVRTVPIPEIGELFNPYRNMGYAKQVTKATIGYNSSTKKRIIGTHPPKPAVKLEEGMRSHCLSAGSMCSMSLHPQENSVYPGSMGAFVPKPPSMPKTGLTRRYRSKNRNTSINMRANGPFIGSSYNDGGAITSHPLHNS